MFHRGPECTPWWRSLPRCTLPTWCGLRGVTGCFLWCPSSACSWRDKWISMFQSAHASKGAHAWNMCSSLWALCRTCCQVLREVFMLLPNVPIVSQRQVPMIGNVRHRRSFSILWSTLTWCPEDLVCCCSRVNITDKNFPNFTIVKPTSKTVFHTPECCPGSKLNSAHDADDVCDVQRARQAHSDPACLDRGQSGQQARIYELCLLAERGIDMDIFRC